MVSLQTTVALATIGVYLLVILALGYRGWQVGTLDVDDWMAAGRGLGIVVLLFTFAASYHSAFAFLGVGGFVYANGISIFSASTFYLVISGVMLWVVGSRVWLLGKKHGYITPSDLLGDFYESELLDKLVSLSLILFTFPLYRDTVDRRRNHLRDRYTRSDQFRGGGSDILGGGRNLRLARWSPCGGLD